MKKGLICVLMTMCALLAGAQTTISLFSDVDLYSYLDDQAGPLVYTNGDLEITFEAFGGVMNRTGEGFGINGDSLGDVTYLLEVNEVFQMTFSRQVQITTLDFRNFESGEAIDVVIGSSTNAVSYADLDNQTGDYLEGLQWDVPAETTVQFVVKGAGDAVAIDSVTVVPEPLAVSMLALGGLLGLAVRRASAS